MKENEKIERRFIAEVRAAGEDRIIRGTAIVFNKESQVLGYWDPFTEIIKPEAVTPELIAESNIVMLWNHEDDMIPLARSKNGKGTLSITITPNGVDFSFEAKNTSTGDEILAAVRAGDVDSCSFAFMVAEEGDQWFSKPDGGYLRTITKFESLHDFSLVNEPAYTEASCRSLEKFKETRQEPPVVVPPVEPPVVVPPVEPPVVVPPVEIAPDNLDEYYKPYFDTIAEFTK